MVWTLRVTFLLFLAWLIFLVSPFVALYDLAKAVEARDVGRIEERVNFHALRASLTRQILGDYLKSPEGQQDLGGLDRSAATGAGTVILNPYVEKLLTPQAVMELLKQGWPQTSADNAAIGKTTPLSFDFSSLSLETLRRAWAIFIASESQGFRSITIPLPEDRPREDQFRLTWRLSGTTWRLTRLELPQAVREELIKRMPPPAG